MSAAANPEPCNCRHCGHPMARYFQASIVPGKAAVAFVTCWQDGCAMNGFTLCEVDYAALDLSQYVGHRPQTASVFASV